MGASLSSLRSGGGDEKSAASLSSSGAGRSVDPLELGAAMRNDKALLGEANGLRLARREGVTAGEMRWGGRAARAEGGVERGWVGVVC